MRGRVQHVLTGTILEFRGWHELQAFLDDQLECSDGAMPLLIRDADANPEQRADDGMNV